MMTAVKAVAVCACSACPSLSRLPFNPRQEPPGIAAAKVFVAGLWQCVASAHRGAAKHHVDVCVALSAWLADHSQGSSYCTKPQALPRHHHPSTHAWPALPLTPAVLLMSCDMPHCDGPSHTHAQPTPPACMRQSSTSNAQSLGILSSSLHLCRHVRILQ